VVQGGVGFRYWCGDRGASLLVGGSAVWHQEVVAEDVQQFTEELWEAARTRVREVLYARTGLMLRGTHPDLERIEWLWIWEPGPETETRVKAFESGLSAMRPAGTRARDLTMTDLAALARRTGAHQSVTRRT